MTRINVVEPQELTNMHLLAEYRELPRIFALAKNFHASGKKEKLPQEYTLGKGHVKFFYNKLLWLSNRQEKLIQELLKRGFAPNFSSPHELIKDAPKELLNDYVVTQEALAINRERIAIRIAEYEEKMKTKQAKIDSKKINDNN